MRSAVLVLICAVVLSGVACSTKRSSAILQKNNAARLQAGGPMIEQRGPSASTGSNRRVAPASKSVKPGAAAAEKTSRGTQDLAAEQPTQRSAAQPPPGLSSGDASTPPPSPSPPSVVAEPPPSPRSGETLSYTWNVNAGRSEAGWLQSSTGKLMLTSIVVALALLLWASRRARAQT